MMHNVTVFNSLSRVETGSPANALGAIQDHDIFVTDASSNVRKIRCRFRYVRFAATVAGLGIPLAFTYDATNGIYCVTGTYAASLLTSFCGISVTANSYAAGNYGWIQTDGPSSVVVVSSAILTLNDIVQHTTAGTTVKTQAAAGNEAGFAKYMGPTQGGAGNITAGSLVLSGGFRLGAAA